MGYANTLYLYVIVYILFDVQTHVFLITLYFAKKSLHIFYLERLTQYYNSK